MRPAGGGRHDRHRCGRIALVSRAVAEPAAHLGRNQSRLAIRRLRGLCAVPHCRSGDALAARSVAIFADPRLYRHGRGDHAPWLGHRRIHRRHLGRLHRPQAHDDLRDPRLFDHDRADRDLIRLDFVCRSAVLVGIAIGSEWATGSSIMAELWPKEARGKGAGLMQCGLGIGFFLASFIWLFVGANGPGAWRYMFLIGILPALLTLWIRTSIDESQAWEHVDARRREARARRDSGAALSANDQALTRFTIADLFVEPETRRRIILAFLMSLTTTLAWWGISSWVPPYIASVAAKANQPGPQWASYAGMAYNFGAILGYISLGFLADRFGRKPVVMFYFAASLLMTPVLFLWTTDLNLLLVAAAVNAFFTLGQHSWMPVWLPELFPTRSRATGIAFSFNAPRFIAFLGPLFAGALILQLRARLLRGAVPAGDKGQGAAGVAFPLISAQAGIQFWVPAFAGTSGAL